MRYYTYISDAKVDMLLPQIPSEVKKNISAKLGFDIKVISGSISTERTTLDNRVSRLEAVESFILSEPDVGDGSTNTPWIHGVFDVYSVDICDDAILFISNSDEALVAFGGSAKHMIGMAQTEPLGISFSYTQRLIEQLKCVVEVEPRYSIALSEEDMKDLISAGIHQGFEAWVSLIAGAATNAKGPIERVRVLARKLAYQEDKIVGKPVVLATPIYLALEE